MAPQLDRTFLREDPLGSSPLVMEHMFGFFNDVRHGLADLPSSWFIAFPTWSGDCSQVPMPRPERKVAAGSRFDSESHLQFLVSLCVQRAITNVYVSCALRRPGRSAGCNDDC